MGLIGRALLVAACVGVSVAGPTMTMRVAVAAPTGDIVATTVPRPPFEAGNTDPILRNLFSTPDGSIACRRVYSEMVWLSCLLHKTNEIVQFGFDESWIEAPCTAPNQTEMCRLSFGMVYPSDATKATAGRFVGARPVPFGRMVELGRRTVPYPACVADQDLGLICTTGMDDQVGEQIVFGRAGSIWSCPGYEFAAADEPVAQGHDRCKVVRS